MNKMILSILTMFAIGAGLAFLAKIYLLPILLPIFPTTAMITARLEKAYYRCGNAYYYGKGVPKNYAKADYWYQKAAEQGYALAQYKLGLAYNNGRGVSKNYAKSYYWMYKAAGKRGYIIEKNTPVILNHGGAKNGR